MLCMRRCGLLTGYCTSNPPVVTLMIIQGHLFCGDGAICGLLLRISYILAGWSSLGHDESTLGLIEIAGAETIVLLF